MSDQQAPSNSQSDQPDQQAKSEPGLGPACMVVAILGLAAVCAFCGLGSWFVFSNQYPLAVKSIDKQLIPWIESSQLAIEDKQSIVAQLEDLVIQLNAQTIDRKQLGRLRNCLQDNPVLLWGGVQSIQKQASDAGLSTTEIATLERTCQRLMRMATDRKLGRTDLEFTLQDLSTTNRDGTSLVKNDLTGDQIRSFLKRADNILGRNKTPNEPYQVTPAEAFEILLKASLAPPEESH